MHKLSQSFLCPASRVAQLFSAEFLFDTLKAFVVFLCPLRNLTQQGVELEHLGGKSRNHVP